MFNYFEYTFEDFMDDHAYIKIDGMPDWEYINNEMDFKLLNEKISESDWLQGITGFNFFVDNYVGIIKDKYKNY